MTTTLSYASIPKVPMKMGVNLMSTYPTLTKIPSNVRFKPNTFFIKYPEIRFHCIIPNFPNYEQLHLQIYYWSPANV